MEAYLAIEDWIEGRMSVKEVFAATGLRSIQAIYVELTAERLDLENDRELAMKTSEEMEEEELRREAWEGWQHWLAEEPAYEEAIVRMLKRERQRKMSEIGRRMRATDPIN